MTHATVFEMQDWEERTYRLMGDKAAEALARAHVMIVGVGGVGAYAAEMIARAGIGRITIVAGDPVNCTNINRQLPALHSTVGLDKVAVMQRRIADINPRADIEALKQFVTADSAGQLIETAKPDFVIDAIDSVSPKVALIKHCIDNGVGIISSMGAGGRFDPAAIRYADISQTRNDGLARVVRTRLKKMGIRKGLPVVWSEELPTESALVHTDEIPCKRSSYGTVSYMPCMFGCMLAAYAINKLRTR